MNTQNTAATLFFQSHSVGYDATFQTASTIGKICRSDSWSTWFRFADDSVLCFDRMSDGQHEISFSDC